MEGIRLEGLERVGIGREAEVFALSDDRVLRLAWSGAAAGVFDFEYAALRAASAVGAPVPLVHSRVEVDGRPGIVMERLGSRHLLLEIGERPWRVFAVARVLGELHARLHGVVAPAELPAVADRLRERLASPLVPDDVRASALEVVERLPAGDRLLHGDFNPANVLPRAGSASPVVVDWTAASRGDPAADVARSELIMRFGAVGPDATPMVRALARVGRRVLVAGYLRAYGPDRGAVSSWMPVMAAVRLVEDIAGERDTLLRLARRR